MLVGAPLAVAQPTVTIGDGAVEARLDERAGAPHFDIHARGTVRVEAEPSFAAWHASARGNVSTLAYDTGPLAGSAGPLAPPCDRQCATDAAERLLERALAAVCARSGLCAE